MTVPIKQTPRPPSQALQKRLNLSSGEADAIVIERAKWNRIKGRVQRQGESRTLGWLSNAATFFLSLATATSITALAVPTGAKSGIDPMVRPGLFIASAAAGLFAAVLLLFALAEQRDRRQQRSDIVNEMETEESAWTTSPAARGSGG